jgi:hypothetical protein
MPYRQVISNLDIGEDLMHNYLNYLDKSTFRYFKLHPITNQQGGHPLSGP